MSLAIFEPIAIAFISVATILCAKLVRKLEFRTKAIAFKSSYSLFWSTSPAEMKLPEASVMLPWVISLMRTPVSPMIFSTEGRHRPPTGSLLK